MKKIGHSWGAKIAAITLQQISMVIVAISLVTAVFCLDRGENLFKVLEEKRYVASDTYQKDAVDKIYELINFLELRKGLETKGEYDLGKKVDIMEYARSRKITESTSEDRVEYYLGDLLNWAKEGYSYREFYEYNDGSIKEAGEENQVYDETTQVLQNINVLSERYLPVDGVSIEKRAGIGNTRSEELYSSLEWAMSSLPEMVMDYKQMVLNFKEGSTNLNYFVLDGGMVYSNIKDFKSVGDVTEAVKAVREMGSYLIMDGEAIEFESNIEIGQRSFYGNIEGVFHGSDDYMVVLGINTDFPVQDTFYDSMINYEKMQPWYGLSIIGGIIGLIVAFIAFIYLTAAAGRSNDSEEIKLNFFDRMKTELAAVITITMIGVVLGFSILILESYGYRNFYDDYYNGDLEIYFVAGVSAFIINGFFLIGYLSLVRRIKAGMLWKNSLVYGFGSLCKRVINNRKIVTKTLLFYGAYLMIVFLFVMITFSGSFFGFLLLLVFLSITGILLVKEGISRQAMVDGVGKISNGDLDYKIDTMRMKGDNKILAESINNIGGGLQKAVEASMKNERLKTDLITNVSHDIKTPLTSIINYVDLIKRENIEDEKIRGYIEVLDAKSQRLKHLTEDLVEASKVSSGTINLVMEKINFVELVHQTTGEFTEKFDEKSLEIISNLPSESIIVWADGKRLWRVIENIYNNTAKYAMENTRVYIDMSIAGEKVEFSVKNISAQPMNINAEELTERFIRGDVSRSTEGSGLGLSIATDLIKLQNGEFEIYVDGDLFKVTIRFLVYKE